MKPTSFLQQKFSRTMQSSHPLAPIFKEIATRLCDRLLDTKYTFQTGLDLGAGYGSVCKALPQEKRPQTLIEADFSLPSLQHNPSITKLVMDANTPFPFAPKTFDLVLANLLLPWLENVPRFLAHAGRVLKDDGLFIASTLGQESFWQLNAALKAAGHAPRVLPPHLPDVQMVGAALQKVGFALPVVDRDSLTLHYPTMAALWADLKAAPALPFAPQQPKGLITPRFLENINKHYEKLFRTPEGYIPLTLEVIYLHGWRPHHSQQKPKPRGSATVQFTDL